MNKINNNFLELTKKTEIYDKISINRQKREIEQLFQKIIDSIAEMSYREYKEYLNNLIRDSPPEIIAPLMKKISNIKEPGKSIKKLAFFLIKSTKPIYNILGVYLIENIDDIYSIPFLIPLIHSDYQKLRNVSMKTVISMARKHIYSEKINPKVMKQGKENNTELNEKSENIRDFIENILLEELKTRSTKKKTGKYKIIKINNT